MQMNLALSRLCRVQVSASAGEGVCTGRPLLRAGVERWVAVQRGRERREGGDGRLFPALFCSRRKTKITASRTGRGGKGVHVVYPEAPLASWQNLQ